MLSRACQNKKHMCGKEILNSVKVLASFQTPDKIGKCALTT